MGVLVWGMMGIAIWHFAIFVPDRFWGGIVGAFIAATIGAIAIGLLVQGFSGRDIDNTDLSTALVAVPGALLGLMVAYGLGLRAESD
jgi:hypothetical protein